MAVPERSIPAIVLLSLSQIVKCPEPAAETRGRCPHSVPKASSSVGATPLWSSRSEFLIQYSDAYSIWRENKSQITKRHPQNPVRFHAACKRPLRKKSTGEFD